MAAVLAPADAENEAGKWRGAAAVVVVVAGVEAGLEGWRRFCTEAACRDGLVDAEEEFRTRSIFISEAGDDAEAETEAGIGSGGSRAIVMLPIPTRSFPLFYDKRWGLTTKVRAQLIGIKMVHKAGWYCAAPK